MNNKNVDQRARQQKYESCITTIGNLLTAIVLLAIGYIVIFYIWLPTLAGAIK